jgi:hypothetical protein
MKPGSATSTFDQHSQPSGIPVHGASRGGAAPTGPDAVALDLHARLRELVPDQAERAALLKVPTNVDAAWLEARMLPVLRAKQKVMRTEIARLEHAR